MLDKNTIHITQKISQSGLCSRRAAKQLIFEKAVTVNGIVVTNPAIQIQNSDEVRVHGKLIDKAPQLKLWLYHKPCGLITTHNDPQKRPTVFEHLPKSLGRVVSVGRLDINSEGLLLLTNIGAFARFLELPATQILRKYLVKVSGELNENRLKLLEKGCIIEGIKYEKAEVKIEKKNWLSVSIREGKNREVRKMLKFCGLRVLRLIRVQYGPYTLGNLPPNSCVEVTLMKKLAAAYKSSQHYLP